MERLPYIDEYAISVPANGADTWQALLTVMCRDPSDPTTVPIGFVLEQASPHTRLALKGRHWFSVYRLVFDLDDTGTAAPSTTVRAQTWAAFPGVKGRIYRGLVIGSGFHRLVVGRMLKRIAAATPRTASTQRP